jgi:NAD(P) transhydrogenase
LPDVGIQVDKDGNVQVDGKLQTAVPGVYAAGDVLGAPSLASTGIEQVRELG